MRNNNKNVLPFQSPKRPTIIGQLSPYNRMAGEMNAYRPPSSIDSTFALNPQSVNMGNFSNQTINPQNYRYDTGQQSR